MKKKTLKKDKFNLDKFEIARLSSMKNIKGGSDGTILTTSGTDGTMDSSKVCRTLK